MRFWAVAGSQRRMAACSNLVWPDTTLMSPESIIGLRTLIAPFQKNVALLSSGEPANSSTLYGALAPLALRPSTRDCAWISPTFSLSNVA